MHDRPDDLGQMPDGDYSEVRDLAERLEHAWGDAGASATGPDLSQFLPPPGGRLRRAALYELIKTDMHIRWDRGRPRSLGDYLEKFPELADDLPPTLILEELRVRRRHNYPTTLSDYQKRYPRQFSELETLWLKEEKQVRSADDPQPAAKSDPFAQTVNHPSAEGPDAVQPLVLGLSQGKVIGGHYVLQQRLGNGQFGEVWKVRDLHGEIDKALKIILRSMESQDSKTELKALQAIKDLNHPFLVRTESYWAEHGHLIVIMELAEGSLRDCLKKCKKEGQPGIPPAVLIEYLSNAAEALDYLHGKNIVHRDIKPENILLIGEYAKIADFGLARLIHKNASVTASFAGTMPYMAPESWSDRFSRASDQYSLAVAYAELRQGKLPFAGRNLADFFHAHTERTPDLQGLPGDEQEVVVRALARDPKQRFSSCVSFYKALDRVVGRVIREDEPSSVHGPRAPAATKTVPELSPVAPAPSSDEPGRFDPSEPVGSDSDRTHSDDAPFGTEKPHDTDAARQKQEQARWEKKEPAAQATDTFDQPISDTGRTPSTADDRTPSADAPSQWPTQTPEAGTIRPPTHPPKPGSPEPPPRRPKSAAETHEMPRPDLVSAPSQPRTIKEGKPTDHASKGPIKPPLAPPESDPTGEKEALPKPKRADDDPTSREKTSPEPRKTSPISQPAPRAAGSRFRFPSKKVLVPLLGAIVLGAAVLIGSLVRGNLDALVDEQLKNDAYAKAFAADEHAFFLFRGRHRTEIATRALEFAASKLEGDVLSESARKALDAVKEYMPNDATTAAYFAVTGHLTSSKKDYVKALESFASATFETKAFKEKFGSKLQSDSLEHAQERLKGGDPEKAEEICLVMINKLDTKDARTVEVLDESLQKIIPKLLERRLFSEVGARVLIVPNEARRNEHLDKLSDAWLKHADEKLAAATFENISAANEQCKGVEDTIVALVTFFGDKRKSWPNKEKAEALRVLTLNARNVLKAIEGKEFTDALKGLQALETKQLENSQKGISYKLPTNAEAKLRKALEAEWRTVAKATFEAASDAAGKEAALAHWKKMHDVGLKVEKEYEYAKDELAKAYVKQANRDLEAKSFDNAVQAFVKADSFAIQKETQQKSREGRMQAKLGHRDQLFKNVEEALRANDTDAGERALGYLEEKRDKDSEYGINAGTIPYRMQGLSAMLSLKKARYTEALERFKKRGNGDKLEAKLFEELCQAFYDSRERFKDDMKSELTDVLFDASANLSRDGKLYEKIQSLNPSVASINEPLPPFPKSVAHLKRIKVSELPKEKRDAYYQLCKKAAEELLVSSAVGTKVQLDQVAFLEQELLKSPGTDTTREKTIKGLYTKYVKGTVTDGPGDSEGWKTRLDICQSKADLKDEWVGAAFQECLLELQMPTKAMSSATIPYAKFIQARLLAKDQLSEACGLLLDVDLKQPWLTPQRRDKAASILQTAALGKRREGELFAETKHAQEAYQWLDQAQKLLAKPLEDKAQVLLALAALFKKDPDWILCDRFAQDFQSNPKRQSNLGPVEKSVVVFLTAKSVSDIHKDFLSTQGQNPKAREYLRKRLEPMLALAGAEGQRKAIWFAAKGWLCRNYPEKRIALVAVQREAFDAYSQALELQPKSFEYWIGKAYCDVELPTEDWERWQRLRNEAEEKAALGKVSSERARGILARCYLEESRNQRDLVDRVKLLIKAQEEYAKATEDQFEVDLLLTGSRIHLELGNYRVTQGLDDAKTQFRIALKLAEEAKKSIDSYASRDVVLLALGNSLEDVGAYASVDGPSKSKLLTNAIAVFAEVMKLSPQKEPSVAALSRARCLYRLGDDKAALEAFDVVLGDKATSEIQRAQAYFYQGKIHDRSNKVELALGAFDEAYANAKKGKQSAMHVDFEINSLVEKAVLLEKQVEKAKIEMTDYEGKMGDTLEKLRRHKSLAVFNYANVESLFPKYAYRIGIQYWNKDTDKALAAFGKEIPDKLKNASTPDHGVLLYTRLLCMHTFKKFTGVKEEQFKVYVEQAERAVYLCDSARAPSKIHEAVATGVEGLVRSKFAEHLLLSPEEDLKQLTKARDRLSKSISALEKSGQESNVQPFIKRFALELKEVETRLKDRK